MSRPLLLLLYFLLIAGAEAYGQIQRTLIVRFSEEDRVSRSELSYKKEHADAGSAAAEIRYIVRKLRKNGYPEASADTVFTRADTIFAYVHAGPRYVWERLECASLEDELFTTAGFREADYPGRPFVAEELDLLRGRILTFAENKGYPFASVSFDSLTMTNGRVRAVLKTQKGPFIVFDTVKTTGSGQVKKNFLIKYTRIIPGKPFSKRLVEEAEILMKQLPYLNLVQQPVVLFENGKAAVDFPVEEVKAGSIEGILGVMPNEQEPGKVLLTGDVHLKLANMFGSGKRAEIRWQRLKEASQFLDLEYDHPVLFGSAVDLNLHFQLLKEDTLFLNLNRALGFRYRTFKAGDLAFRGGYKTSRLISSAVYEQASELPEFSDTDFLSYGLGWSAERTDNSFFPRRGYAVETEALAGNRTVRKSALLPDSLYRDVPLKSAQFIFKLRASLYLPLSKNVSILTRVAGGKLLSKKLFFNELFRVGGLQSLRGFNENYFFASDYALATAECRIYGEANTYIAFFYDQAYVRDTRGATEYPFGFGTSFGLLTKAGVFSLVWAFGKSEDQPLSINRSKIHFGITGKF